MPKRPYDVVTFDCYGTLVDWEEGIARAFIEAAAEAGVAIDRRAVIESHAEIEPRVQSEPYRSYREVLQETAVRVAQRCGWSITREQARFLPRSLPAWSPFPDTVPALRRLSRAGYRLGLISNVDDDLLAGTLSGFDVPFEHRVTAEQVRSYKPAPAHFLEARKRIGEARWLHAAQSYFHDVAPAAALAVPVAWINRKAERPSGAARPDRELSDLTELADWLGC